MTVVALNPNYLIIYPVHFPSHWSESKSNRNTPQYHHKHCGWLTDCTITIIILVTITITIIILLLYIIIRNNRGLLSARRSISGIKLPPNTHTLTIKLSIILGGCRICPALPIILPPLLPHYYSHHQNTD